jgi:hypothetical protein
MKLLIAADLYFRFSLVSMADRNTGDQSDKGDNEMPNAKDNNAITIGESPRWRV